MNETAQRWRHRAAHHGVAWLLKRPGPYYGTRPVLRQIDSVGVSQSTELVTEGFPRSSNGITVYSFVALRDRLVAVAHHKHHIIQMAFRTRPLLCSHEPTDLRWHALPDEIRLSIKNDLCVRLKEEFRCGRLHDMLTRCSEICQKLTAPR